MVPPAILNVAGMMLPLALVCTNCVKEGAVQPTPTGLLMGEPRATVGSLEASLHSKRFPMELSVKPDPVTATDVPLAKPVLGLIAMVPVFPAADATADVTTSVSPVVNSVTAPRARILVIPR
jgi:hypothetical protein